MHFQTDSIVVAMLVFFVVAIVPVKLVAGFFGVKNDSFLASFIALIVSIPAFYLGAEFTGLGYLGAYIVMCVAVWFVMRPTLFGAFLIPAVAVIFMFGVIQALSHFGFPGFGDAGS